MEDADVVYHVQCEVFEGPIDLLISLAHRGQIDVDERGHVPLTLADERHRVLAHVARRLDPRDGR